MCVFVIVLLNCVVEHVGMLFVCWGSVVLDSMEEPGQLKQAFINATAGAASGAVSRTVTSPLDVIKIRFQVLFFDVSLWLSFFVSVELNWKLPVLFDIDIDFWWLSFDSVSLWYND